MRIEGCTSGAYYLRNRRRKIIAVFKPCAEEPGAIALDSFTSSGEVSRGIAWGCWCENAKTRVARSLRVPLLLPPSVCARPPPPPPPPPHTLTHTQQEQVQQYDFGVEPSDSLAAREVLAAIVSSGSSHSSSGSQSMWNRGSGNSVPPTTLAYVR